MINSLISNIKNYTLSKYNSNGIETKIDFLETNFGINIYEKF